MTSPPRFLPVVVSLGAELLGGAPAAPRFPARPTTRRAVGRHTGHRCRLAGDLANLPPMRRKWLLWELAGFTGGDTENHLITFREFVAHHLLAWSPRVWRTIPTFATSSRPPHRRRRLRAGCRHRPRG